VNQQYQQNGYGQPNMDQQYYGQMPRNNTLNNQGFAIAGMVLGILSIVCCCSWFGLIFGIVGFVLSMISLQQHRPGKSMATAGVVCSAVGVVIFIILLIASANSGVSTDFWENFLRGYEYGKNLTL
ncbi:MAG: DUF4190 domain-containing protein, partial [Clostridiaceae bacterium]|nr:DUF4190 domain-containing protein [Clostridiaceae bacterium]